MSQEAPTALPVEHSAAAATYANTKDGLQNYLEEVLAVAKSGDHEKVRALLKQSEIPNYREWFFSMYAPDSAESWAEPYGRELNTNEEMFGQIFERLARSEGKVFIRKVNDDPKPGQGMEWGMLQAARKPLDIYYAGWIPVATDRANVETIGYFLYIDGMFRWDSLIHVVRPKIVRPSPMEGKADRKKEKIAPLSGPAYKVGGSVSAPHLIVGVPPEFTEEAKRANLQGTVVLSLIVDTDGRAKEITVVRSLGGGLDEQAMKAARKWKFTPGMKEGQPVPVKLNVEMNFHLY